MAYRRGNYNFAIDNGSFRPFTMEEQLVPFVTYQKSFEKAEQAYTDLATKALKYQYLSDTLPEGSKARAVYEGYANDLKAGAKSLAHGLSLENRSSLTDLKERYAGEIGRLDRAQKMLDTYDETRRKMSTNDPTRIYASQNLTIDDFMDGKKPNDYSVSGNDLYKAGAAAATSATSKMWSDVVSKDIGSKYYIDLIQKQGASPELLMEFRDHLSAIPEFQKAVEGIAKRYGIEGNLTGDNLARAYESIINGMVDGSVYKRTDNIQRDYSNPTWSEEEQQREFNEDLKRKDADTARQNAISDAIYAEKGWKYDPTTQKMIRIKKNFTPVSEIPGVTGGGKGGTKGGTKGGIKDGTNSDMVKIDTNGDGVPDRMVPKDAAPTLKDYFKRQNQLEDARLADENNGEHLYSENDDDSGFDLNVGKDAVPYKYVAAVARHGGHKEGTEPTWSSGAIGEDDPGQDGIEWGWFTNSNVTGWSGNFSVEDIDRPDRKNMRILSREQVKQLPKGAIEHINNIVRKEAIKKYQDVIDAHLRMLKESEGFEALPEDKQFFKLQEERESIIKLAEQEAAVIKVPQEGDTDQNGYLVAFPRQQYIK